MKEPNFKEIKYFEKAIKQQFSDDIKTTEIVRVNRINIILNKPNIEKANKIKKWIYDINDYRAQVLYDSELPKILLVELSFKKYFK